MAEKIEIKRSSIVDRIPFEYRSAGCKAWLTACLSNRLVYQNEIWELEVGW